MRYGDIGRKTDTVLGLNDEEDGAKVQLAVEIDSRRQKQIKFRDRNSIV